MDPEELNNNGVGNDSTPLLVSEMEESSHGDALSIRGGGEEEEENASRFKKRVRIKKSQKRVWDKKIVSVDNNDSQICLFSVAK